MTNRTCLGHAVKNKTPALDKDQWGMWVFLLKCKGINDVETIYLNTHNSYKLEEGKWAKLVNLQSNNLLFVRSSLHSAYYLVVPYRIYCVVRKDKVKLLSVKRQSLCHHYRCKILISFLYISHSHPLPLSSVVLAQLFVQHCHKALWNSL